jgi:hypothetical protein
VTPPHERRHARWALAGTFAAALLVHLPGVRNGFVPTWDDGNYVLYNQDIAELSLATVRWAFTSIPHYSRFWAPFTFLSYAVDHAVWGLDPFGYHLTNALLHALSTALVFLLALELVPEERWPVPTAALAALLWALHPLRVESVAWIAERKDVLSAAFGVAAVLAYVRHAKGSARPAWRSRAHWAALALAVLSLASKPTLATLPAVLLVLDAYLGRFRREGARALLVEKAPWVLLAAIATVVTAIGFEGCYIPLERSGVLSSVLIGLRATWEYLRFTAWPVALSPFHLYPGQVSPLDPAYLLPALAVVALAVAAVAGARRWPAPAAVYLCYLALVAPGALATRTGMTEMADRFTYFPAIPLSILAAAAFGALATRATSRAARAGIIAAAAAVLMLLSALTVRQTRVWRDEVTLWTGAIEARPGHSGRVYESRAAAWAERGEWDRASADLGEAIAIAAAKRYVGLGALYAQRARFRARSGDREAAAADWARAIASAPPDQRAAFEAGRAEAGFAPP